MGASYRRLRAERDALELTRRGLQRVVLGFVQHHTVKSGHAWRACACWACATCRQQMGVERQRGQLPLRGVG